jgi:hypothetical protein
MTPPVTRSTSGMLLQMPAARMAGTCSVTPTTELAPGAGQWYIQAYNVQFGLEHRARTLPFDPESYDDFSEIDQQGKWGQGNLSGDSGWRMVSKASGLWLKNGQ